MNSPPTLRPVDSSDKDFLLELVASTHEDLAIFDRVMSALLVRLQYEAQLSDYRRRFPRMEQSIVLADGKPAGRLYVARQPNQILLLDISLLPAFRRRQIGRCLLTRLKEECARTGVPLRLHVLQESPARALYERLGFQAGAVEGMYQAMEWNPQLSKE